MKYGLVVLALIAVSGCASDPEAGRLFSQSCKTAGFHSYSHMPVKSDGFLYLMSGIDWNGEINLKPESRRCCEVAPAAGLLSFGFKYIDFASAYGEPTIYFNDGFRKTLDPGIFRISLEPLGDPRCHVPKRPSDNFVPVNKCIAIQRVGDLSQVKFARFVFRHEPLTGEYESKLGFEGDRERLLDRQQGPLADYTHYSVKGFYGDVDHVDCGGSIPGGNSESSILSLLTKGL